MELSFSLRICSFSIISDRILAPDIDVDVFLVFILLSASLISYSGSFKLSSSNYSVAACASSEPPLFPCECPACESMITLSIRRMNA